MINRTSQKNIVKEEGQRKLSELNVGIVGLGSITHHALANMIGLGIAARYSPNGQGIIHLIDSGEEQGPAEFLLRCENVESLDTAINSVDKDICIEMHSSFKSLEKGTIDILMDFTNDVESKEESIDYANKYKIPFISASSTKSYSSLAVHPKKKEINDKDAFLMKQYNGMVQGDIVSSIPGAVAVEELRKICLIGDSNIRVPIHYSLLSGKRFDLERNLDLNFDFSDKNVLVVGAGSLGTVVGLLYAQSAGNRGNVLTIVDGDIIQPHNINRQIFYAGMDNGKIPKVEAFKAKISRINPNLRIDNYFSKLGIPLDEGEKSTGAGYFGEEFIRDGDFNLILGCVDDNDARRFLNNCCVKYKIPYVDGAIGPGLGYEKGWVNIYIPNETPCLACQRSLTKGGRAKLCSDAQTEEERIPSLIMPNWITGTLQVGEGIKLLSGYRETKGMLVYHSTKDFRIGFSPRNPDEKKHCEFNCYLGGK